MPKTGHHPESVDLDALDAFLLSDRAPETSMGLSNLDGFLTAIVVGPELIMPSEWLPVVWGGEEPTFEDMEEAQRVLSLIMARYNEIVRGLQDGGEGWGPIFWETPDGYRRRRDSHPVIQRRMKRLRRSLNMRFTGRCLWKRLSQRIVHAGAPA